MPQVHGLAWNGVRVTNLKVVKIRDTVATNRTDDRSAQAVNIFLRLTTDRNLSAHAYVGTGLFRAGSRSVQGGLAID